MSEQGRPPPNSPVGRPAQPDGKDAIAKRLELTAKKIKFRRYVVAGAFTIVTIMGAWYGASLKTGREIQKERKKVFEASDEEVIEYLTTRRKTHVRAQAELEKKLDVLRKRIDERTKKEAEERGRPMITAPPPPQPTMAATTEQPTEKSVSWWNPWGGKG